MKTASLESLGVMGSALSRDSELQAGARERSGAVGNAMQAGMRVTLGRQECG